MADGARCSVGYASAARKQLDKLDRQVARRFTRAISALGDDPRQRDGEYRIIYTIKDAELIVLALRIGHRSDVHRRIRPAAAVPDDDA